jgi:hypothetical protein
VKRSQPLRRTGGLARRAPLVARLTDQKPRRAHDTGPNRKTRQTVAQRAGGLCEWPGCGQPFVHLHHRCNRGMGGRYGDAAARLNGAAWLLAVCLIHHERVTSAVGDVLAEVRAAGWVLVDGEDAAGMPVMVRHWPAPVLLRDDGTWTAA